MTSWYKVGVFRAHNNKKHTTTAYIFAKNPCEVLQRYKTMPGVKKDLKNAPFPSISEPLEQSKIKTIEELIKKAGISDEKAKKTWVYSEYI